MRIFSKKSFQFDHPTGAVEPVTVKMQSFADVPEWVTESTMYKLAKIDGDVERMDSRQDEVKAENGISDEELAKAKAKADSAAKAKADKEAAAKEKEEKEAAEKAKAEAEANAKK